MGLHLGEIEVRTMAVHNELLGVVEEIQAEVEKTSRDGGTVDNEVLLLQMPTARARIRQLDSTGLKTLQGTYRTMRVGRGLSVRSL